MVLRRERERRATAKCFCPFSCTDPHREEHAMTVVRRLQGKFGSVLMCFCKRAGMTQKQ
jgi:hypothetical protein